MNRKMNASIKLAEKMSQPFGCSARLDFQSRYMFIEEYTKKLTASEIASIIMGPMQREYDRGFRDGEATGRKLV